MESGYRGQLEVKIKVLSCPLCSSPQHPLTTLCGKGSQVVTKVAKKPQTYPAEAAARKRVNKLQERWEEIPPSKKWWFISSEEHNVPFFAINKYHSTGRFIGSFHNSSYTVDPSTMMIKGQIYHTCMCKCYSCTANLSKMYFVYIFFFRKYIYIWHFHAICTLEHCKTHTNNFFGVSASVCNCYSWALSNSLLIKDSFGKTYLKRTRFWGSTHILNGRQVSESSQRISI